MECLWRNLNDLAGNQMQIKANEKVQMSMEIPSGMLFLLRHLFRCGILMRIRKFGLRRVVRHEMEKSMSGIGHFSFWNCDAPNGFIKLEMTLVDQNNFPLSGVLVFLHPSLNKFKISGDNRLKRLGWWYGTCQCTNLKMANFYSRYLWASSYFSYGLSIPTL